MQDYVRYGGHFASWSLTIPRHHDWQLMTLRRVADRLRQAYLIPTFKSSGSYWDQRYRLGGSSGEGSYGPQAEFKAQVLNEFVRVNDVQSVIEFGCGDGAQLKLADYPRYLGLDVATASIERCRRLYENDDAKTFLHYKPQSGLRPAHFLKADLTMSLDVVYHLVEDDVFEYYIRDLFEASKRFVIIYATNVDQETRVPHVRHRAFAKTVEALFPEAELLDHIASPHVEDPPCDFYIYARGR